MSGVCPAASVNHTYADFIVPREAGAVEVHLPQLVLSPKVVAVGGSPIPPRRLDGIRRHRAALRVEVSDRPLGRGAAVVRCLPVPVQCQPSSCATPKPKS